MEAEDQPKRYFSNIPIPDPSIATNERLAAAISSVEDRIHRNREEVKYWVESLQTLLEESLNGAVKVLETRLNGNDLAIVAALQSQKEAAQKQADAFSAILTESKSGSTKQIDSLNEKIDDIKARQTESGGVSQGTGKATSMVIALFAAGAAAISALAAIVSVIMVLSRPSQVDVHPSTPHPNVSLRHSSQI